MKSLVIFQPGSCIFILHGAPQMLWPSLVSTYSAGVIIAGSGSRTTKGEGQSRQLGPNDTRKWNMCGMDSFLGNWLLHLSVMHMLRYKHFLVRKGRKSEKSGPGDPGARLSCSMTCWMANPGMESLRKETKRGLVSSGCSGVNDSLLLSWASPPDTCGLEIFLSNDFSLGQGPLLVLWEA